jgi:hypothetical protein
MDTQRSHRRIVPPTLPPSTGDAPPVSYARPKYVDPDGGKWKTVVIIGALVVVVVAGAFVALEAFKSPTDPAVLAAVQERTAQTDGTQQDRAKDETAAGWVGVLDLPNERATVLISTVPDDGSTAHGWNENLGEQVSVATLSIDNSQSPVELVVDTSQAMLQLTENRNTPTVESIKVLQTAKRDRENLLRDQSPPFRCAAGQRMTDKAIFLPRGTDPHTIMSVALMINGMKREITGQFMDSARKSAFMRSKGLRTGTYGAPAAAPAPAPAPAPTTQ